VYGPRITSKVKKMIEVDVQRNKVNSGVWCVATAEENSVRLIKKKR